MNTEKEETILMVSPEHPETRWVALNSENIIIAEGKVPEEAIAKAKTITDDFVIMFIPDEENNYVF